jgi:hypothetical protein
MPTKPLYHHAPGPAKLFADQCGVCDRRLAGNRDAGDDRADPCVPPPKRDIGCPPGDGFVAKWLDPGRDGMTALVFALSRDT